MKLRKCLFCLAALGFYSTVFAGTNPDKASSDQDSDFPFGMAGPIRFTPEYSDQFGIIVNAKWTNYLTHHNAFGFEVDYGPDEFRLGGTLAHAISDNQRFKLTAEHLGQQLNFNFASGMESQFVGMNDFAGAYQYLIHDSNWAKSIELGAYHTNTETENLTSLAFPPPYYSYLDIRRLTGANSAGASGTLNVSPWQNALLGLTLNYDNVSYNTLYSSPLNSSGLGGTLALDQILTPHWKVDLLASVRQPYQMYKAGTYWLFNTKPGTRLELGAFAYHLAGDIPTSTDDRIGMTLAYSWGGNPDSPKASFIDEAAANRVGSNLIDYASDPAIHMAEVLVMKDELVQPQF